LVPRLRDGRYRRRSEVKGDADSSRVQQGMLDARYRAPRSPPRTW
jgi:hypothetical protein